MDVTAIVITGSPGAGKSSVLEKLGTMLEIEDVAFGALECEQLSWGSPPLDGEPWYAQIAAVTTLQRRAGRRLFLVAVTAETSAELAAVCRAIGARRTVVVLLRAPADVVAARVAEREPDSWPGKQWLITHARELAVAMDALQPVDVRLDTDGRVADDVAAELRERLRALGVALA